MSTEKATPAKMETTRPNPDPTALSTEQLLREVHHLNEAINCEREIRETRLTAMDKALSLLQSFADKSPTTAAVGQSVSELAKLTEEKFRSVETSLKERDARTEQTSKDSKIAVDAAFAAAKEAVAEQNKSNALSISKSEAAFTKLLDGITVLITATNKGTEDKISSITALNATSVKSLEDKIIDTKSRLGTIETAKATVDRGQDRSVNMVGVIISAAVAAVIIVSAIVGVVVFVLSRH